MSAEPERHSVHGQAAKQEDLRSWGGSGGKGKTGVRAAARALAPIAPIRGALRTRETLIFAIQAAIAAGLALWVADHLGSHEQTFFASIAAVICVGVAGGRRLRRTFELALGVAVGIGIGDFVISHTGTGYWQVALVVLLAITAATFVDRSQVVAMQAATTGVLIATILPPSEGQTWVRMIDALVGGAVAVVVMAIIPNSPLRPARRMMSVLLAKAALVLDEVAVGVDERDAERIRSALQEARGTQGQINTLLDSADGGAEMIAVSPLYWNARRHNETMERQLAPVDNMMRNTRVLARRAAVLIADGVEPHEDLGLLLHALANEVGHLSEVFAQGGTRGSRSQTVEIPEIARSLQRLAARTPLSVAEGTGLSGMVVLAQIRSIIVDLLEVCGWSNESAKASLAPTVESPDVPPEVWY